MWAMGLVPIVCRCARLAQHQSASIWLLQNMNNKVKANQTLFLFYLADELNVLPLDLLDHHDLHLVQEVEGQIAQSISEKSKVYFLTMSTSAHHPVIKSTEKQTEVHLREESNIQWNT